MDPRIKLRIEYLRANLKYLNDTESEEYNRLTGQRLVRQNRNSQQNNTPYQNTNQDRYYAQPHRNDAQSYEQYNDQATDGLNTQQSFKQPKKPKTKKKRKKVSLLKKIRRFLLLLIILMIGFFIYGYHQGKSKKPEGLKTEKFSGQKAASGATNILILGTDQRDFQNTGDARSDSIMVMQINSKDHKIKLVSFMRDTLVYQPGVSQYGADTKINVAYNIGEQDHNQGAEYMREVLKKNFNIDIQYYALVNFNSFATVIDSLYPFGLKIDAKFSTVNQEKVSSVKVPDDLNWTPQNQDPIQVIKSGVQKMDGRTLLNYARFRKDDEGDFGRTKRQQQVMQAIMSGVKNPLTLFTGSSALGTIRGVTSTDVSNLFMLTHAPRILFDASKGIESYTVPENGDWTDQMDQYGGAGLLIDFDKYNAKLKDILG